MLMMRRVMLLTVVMWCMSSSSRSMATRVGFYDRSCPPAESIVKATVRAHTQADITIPAALLRLHFHDCFVRGCDGSVLIDGPNAEKVASANQGLRGFEVIDEAKAKIEAMCPGIVSCADILALAAQSAVELSNGPSWRVPLGRLDGTISSAFDVSNMPSPTDPIIVIKEKFDEKGLSEEDLVLLTGAHTIGQTDCGFFEYRLYNFQETGEADPSMSTQAQTELRNLCPVNGDGSNRVALDRGSPTTFDTSFFKNVNGGFAVLESDQSLMSDSSTALYVRRYGGKKNGGIIGGIIGGILGGGSPSFGPAFARSMVKMSNIDVKVDDNDDNGEIRRVCSRVN
ncbi:hypothetical protein GOP47_0025342 [Adiantum capillus-veneris]|uniref:Peroxidase n=1 Tax=Adiantum capillus-veneris TaxID=13818 RepID=A0A9D4U0H5_ADICA|nr:hypothetical protein GOP47_0025342 [Adiantum capillus-veneris]